MSANNVWRRFTRAVAHVVSVPVRSTATIGRGVLVALSVLRYTIVDTISFRLPVGEMLVEAWALLKVTATPALLMAIPIGAIVSIQTAGLVTRWARVRSSAQPAGWASCGRALR